MSGTSGNIKDRGDMSEKKKGKRCTCERGKASEKKKRSLSLESCPSEREDASEKEKGTMALERCSSEREGKSKKKKTSMSLERCTSEREDASKKEKTGMYLQRCTSEGVVFSDDFISEILIRLPTKALHRCKCVCKNWRSLISEDNFLKNFITRSKLLPPLLTGMFYAKDICESCLIEGKVTDFLDFSTLKTTINFVDTLPVDICLSFLKRSILAVAAHNGFVLFAERPEKATVFTIIWYRFNYIVCNPLTRQFVDLPKPRCTHNSQNTYLFCYNKKGSSDQQIEFKVVSLLIRDEHESKVEVYSSETGKWKLSSIFPDEVRSNNSSFMFNGSVYFWGQRHLLVYDVMEETMRRKVELPTNAFGMGLFGVSDGSLYFAESSRSFYWVYVLVDGVGWNLVHKVEFASFCSAHPDIFGLHNPCYFSPGGFHPLNHELVLVESVQYIIYHTGTGKMTVIDGFDRKPFPKVIPYSLPAWLPSLPMTLGHKKPNDLSLAGGSLTISPLQGAQKASRQCEKKDEQMQ